MHDSRYNTAAGSLPQDAPVYSPLSSEAERVAMDLLLRKGALLEPRLTRDETQQILHFMRAEHFAPGAVISFQAQSSETGRLMMILAGEANIRMRSAGPSSKTQFSPVDQTSRWFTATEGATLGLIHAFSGLSSRFVAQASTELFVASISRDLLQAMKKQMPALALRYTEMLMLELALVALDHERNLQAMNNVARSMQNHIDDESGATKPAPLF
jgi:CRP-like cAMP-binding protein